MCSTVSLLLLFVAFLSHDRGLSDAFRLGSGSGSGSFSSGYNQRQHQHQHHHHHQHRHQLKPLHMSLELKTIQIPVQADYSKYYAFVTEAVKEEELLRWYIASIEDTIATIEIVYEENGVGSSGRDKVEALSSSSASSSSSSLLSTSPSASSSSKPISFEQAMDSVSDWISSWDSKQLSDEDLADKVGAMVGTMNGARGFFVVSLTSESTLMDNPPAALVNYLREAKDKDSIVSLMCMNLAMSTAMVVHHGRNNDEQAKGGSRQVQDRSKSLLRCLDTARVKTLMQEVILSKDKGEAFMKQWGYDEEQKGKIREEVELLLSSI